MKPRQQLDVNGVYLLLYFVLGRALTLSLVVCVCVSCVCVSCECIVYVMHAYMYNLHLNIVVHST